MMELGTYNNNETAKNGVKIQHFEDYKKVPLDILEIHVVSKFGPIPMKIASLGAVTNKQINEQTNERQTSITPYRGLYLKNSIKPSTTLNYSP